jgi:hypothetical protein
MHVCVVQNTAFGQPCMLSGTARVRISDATHKNT